MRRSTLVKGALVAFLALATIEISLHLAASLASWDRGDAGLRDDHWVVLAIGDSHTWGRGKGYPYRLAQDLEKRSDRYRVINLGVPGTNTAQLRKRVADYVAQYRPVAIAVWAGINNSWNQADIDVWSDAGAPPPGWFETLVSHSRIVRFVRVWLRDAELERALRSTSTYIQPGEAVAPGGNPWFDHEREVLGGKHEFRNVAGGKVPAEILERVTAADIAEIARIAAERRIPVVFVTYVSFTDEVKAINVGIRTGAKREHAPVVESHAVVTELEEKKGMPRKTLFDRYAHPTQPYYDAVGDHILEELDRLGSLPDARASKAPRVPVP